MKTLGKIGFMLSILTLGFALYVHFVVAPAADEAEVKREQIIASVDVMDGGTYFDVPGYKEAMEDSEKKTDFGGYLFFASMLPTLLCLIGSFSKDKKMALIGLVLSLGAFFIGAAYGTHMFS